MLKIKKNIIEKAKERGVIDRLNILLSVAYLLLSDASLFMAEAELLTERNGLKLGELKYRFSQLNQIFDRLTDSYAKMIDSTNKDRWIKDLDELDKIMHTWQSIPEVWNEGDPQYVEDRTAITFRCKEKTNE